MRSFLTLAMLVVLAGCDSPKPPAKAATEPAIGSTADSDYYAFLALSYEERAVSGYKMFWLGEAEKFANFK